MPINSKIKSLYDALKADGADVGSEQEFSDWFQAPGEQGYNNRKYVYDTFKADGADVGKYYEEFAGWLGLHAVQPQVAQAGTMRQPTGQTARDPQSPQQEVQQPAQVTPREVVATQATDKQEPQQSTDVKQKIQPAELTEKEVGDDLAFMREVNRSQGNIPEDAPQDQDSRSYWMPHYDKNWKAGYSQSWGKMKGLFDGLDYGKKDATSSLDAAVNSRYDGMSDQAIESELQKLSKEYKAGEWDGVEDSLRAHIQRLQMNLVAHEYGFKNYGDMMSRRGEAEYEMYKYHPAFDQEWLATYNGGPGENPLVNMGKEIVKKQLIEDTMNGVPRPEGYYQSLPFRDKEFSKRYASWALKRAKVLGSQAFADVWDNGIKEWEAYIGAGLLESGAEEAMAQGAGYGDVGIAGGKYNADFDAAAATAWGMAEDEYRRLSGAHSNEIWGDYASMGGGREARMVASGEWAVSNMADRLSSHDLDKMIDNAWKSLGESKQKQIVLAAAQNLKQQYPGMSPAEMVKTAQSMVRQQTIQRVLDYAKEQNAPKNVVDYFARKVLEQNSIFKIQEAMARSRAGTTGDWQARDMAMQEYGKNHRIAGVAGTVVGMGLDPVTYISAGVGKGAAAGTVKLIEKLGGAAGRKWLTTTAGKVVVGAAGGAANLGTFEGLNETLNQLRWGGSPAVDLKTGLIKTTGYDAKKVGKAIFHGTTMGAGTGIVAPLVGNVWSPFMEATSSTAGKMAVKTGELFTGTIAEGTIFSIPDVYNAYTESENIIKSFSDKKSRNYISDEQERAKAIAKVRESRNETMLDAWSESVATMAGFKMKHVGQRLYELSQSGNGRAGFETRLRYMLDRKPDLALTKDEQAELERGGYADLKELADEYVEAEKNRRANSKPVVTGKPRPLELGTREEDMPYNRFVDLMNDGSISEAARAKMYYYITGHALPMSTVMYGQLTENKDRDGNVKGYTVQSIGANGVVISREFTSRKRAENELQKVNRQIELNTIDIGERYNESVGNSTKELREEIGQKYGVDVEKALKKEPKRRTAGEQMALDEYMRMLFPEKEAREEDAEDVTFSEDTSVTDETTNGFTDEATDESDAIVVETLNRTGEDGMIHPAVLKGEDEVGVDIVSGNVVTLADGTIDVASSDQDIIIVDAKGQRLMININDIASIGTPIDPNAAMAAAEQANTVTANAAPGVPSGTGDTVVSQAANTAAVTNGAPGATQGSASIEVGGRYNVVDEQNTQHEVEVLRDNGNGTVEVRVDGAEDSMPMVKSQLEQMLGVEAATMQQPTEQSPSDAEATNDMVEADVPEAGSERYSVDPNADERAMGMAGFSEQDIAATVDYLNGKLGEREYLKALGVSPSTLEGMGDNAIERWANSTAEGASEFITDEAVESGEVRVESDEDEQSSGRADEVDVLPPTPSNVEVEPEEDIEAMPMLEDGNPDYSQVDASRAHDYLYSDESGLDKSEADEYVQAQIDAAEKALSKIDKRPLKMGTDLAKYRAEKQRRQEQLDAAKANVDYWERVKAIEADREAQAAAERKAKDAEVIAQAQAEEQARQAAEVAKQQEQAERGAGAVHPAIAEKWDNAPKIEGYKDEVVLANGERVPGTYYLVESGAVTPSHNASREFEKYEGFPVDENGNTINDRDYERDKDAQNITRSIADKYDSRALQTPVIVSKDGVVLSGNGRTMAGELAASNNTDGAYIEHLKNYGRKYGFSPEQVTSMKHPRAVFVPDADMPYTTDTFAKFNAQEMKGQSKTEQAVKLGKVVDDATFNQVVRAINEHETLGDFYGDTKAATEAINALRRAGAINDMQYAEMFDGDAVSDRGRQIIENMLIGKAFEGNPDVIRMLTEYKGFRQSVVTALNEISTNVALGKDYSLENELAQAIELAYKARKAGFKENELVSPYATQLNLFPFEDGETVADYNNAAVLLLADMLNDKRPTLLKKKLQDYNQQSAESAAGQMDIFSGSVKDKKEIIKTVLNTLHNGEREETQRPEQRGPVADERGGEASLQEDGAAGQPEQGESNIQGLESYSEEELRGIVEEHVRSAIADADMDAEITGIRFIGSRTTGTARADSDLDVLVEYQGTAREDSLFNVLNDEDNRLVIDGITIDINPITPGKSGTIEEFMRRNAGYKKETTVQEQIALAEQQTETSPSEAQKEAGNYKKGHVKIDGFDVSIEQPKGSVRSGVDASGKSWSQKMNNTYGYIRGTEGVDGDHIDVFLSDDPSQGDVFVVDQVNNDGSFDEHKVMYGFNSEDDARQAYLSNYEDGWQGLGAITAVSKDEFKKWIGSSHRKTKPFAEYKNVKVEGEQADALRQPTGQTVDGDTHPVSTAKSSQKSEVAEAPKERIDDVGEKIEGAKKDLAKKMGERINLDADTFPKMFPKYDLKKLISQGLDPSLAVMTKMLRQMAQADYKHYSKKRMYGKSYALRASRFYAAYAKQVLEAGDSNVDFKSEGLGFTDYGKQFVELNKRLFEELHKKLGDDIFDLDLTGVKMQPISQKEGTTWYRRNQETGESEPYNPAYAFIGPRGQSYYEANELDKALQEGVEQVSKSIDYKKTHPYKLGHYYKPGVKNSDYVGMKLGGKVVPLTEPMTSSEVRKYMSEHNAELQAKAAQLDEQRKLDKKKGGTGEGRWKPELTLGGGRPRVGADRRGGVDIEAEEFMKSFGFRGVQFGNYVTQHERQRFLNEAYDALMDMAELLGISPRALAIDGRLGLAIGARGGGKANAHYEPKENVINLTKSKGAGSLAHEWFHALDYYFNKSSNRPTSATSNKSAEQFPASTRDEMRKAFLDLMRAIKDSDYYYRSVALEQKLHPQQLGEGYYNKPTELGARAFQDYVVRKLTDQGKINDFLSSFTSEKDWNGEPENYPYPVGAEAEKIDEKFDALFDAMQERTDEEGNTILYHLGKDNDVLTDTEVALRDGLVEVLRGAGIEVVTDEAEGQRVLDAANRAADVLDEMKKRNQQQETALPEDESSFKGTAISSADGAKIIKNLESGINALKKIAEGAESVPNAMTREDLSQYGGDNHITFIFGKTGDPSRSYKGGYGIAHIGGKHGADTLLHVLNVIAKGKIDRYVRGNKTVVLSDGKYEVVLGLTRYGNKETWLFNGWRKEEKTGADGEVSTHSDATQANPTFSREDLGAVLSDAKIQQIVDTSKDLPGKIREMRAWHGSGADFDAFDHNHMSEGEGAQAYGWGTYVTQVEGIARSYAEVNAKKPPYLSVAKRHRNTAYENFINSRNAVESCKRDIENYEKRITANKEYIEELEDSRTHILKEHGESSVELENWDFLGQKMLSQVREEIEADKKRIASSREYLRNLEKMLPYLESEYEKAKAEVLRLDAMTKRYLYEVEIPDNDGTNYLSWDEPLTDEQLERIASRLGDEDAADFRASYQPVADAPNADEVNAWSRRGENILKQLSWLFDHDGRNNSRAVSEFLHDCGFVGIEYPAQYRSGGRSDGAKNYVIFDEGDLKINSKAQFFRTGSGEVYGFVRDGKIYIDPRVASAETPVHEYSHLWADALKRANPEAWERLKETMLGEKDVLEHVKRLYPELEGDELLAEVFSHYSGKRGAERLRADMEREMKNAEDVFAKARVARVFDIIRRALSRFWEMARDLFAGKNSMLNGMSAEDFADMAMADMLRGFDPRGEEKDRGEAMVANEGEVLYEPTARTTGLDIALDDRFNKELSEWEQGKMPSNKYLSVGVPTGVLENFMPSREIILRQKVLTKALKKHGLVASDIKNLPSALAAPIFIFRSTPSTISVLTELQTQEGKNIFVAIELNTTKQMGHEFLELNDILTIHGREEENIVKPIIENNSLLWVDKEKGQHWLSSAKTNSQAITNDDLDTAANIVKDFENPSIKTENYVNERGDVIRFESHAEQLSLFGGGEQSSKRAVEQTRGQALSERVKRASEMSDAELLSEMGRDIAELEKAGRADWGVQTLYSEEYDRRHVKEYNEECDRVRTMLDENNVGIEEAEQMLLDTIFTWREGYATADRSRLLAQFDTLNSYYAEKEDERDNADLVESEAAAMQQPTEQTADEAGILPPAPSTLEGEKSQKPKRAGGFNPTEIKLRKLKGGETCHVERRYQESGGFDFTGSEKVESDADLAYIFRNLENSAIENTFLVLIKNGKATILHVGMGGYAFSAGHLGAGVLAASQLKPDSVIFVHNHPSGTLQPSQQDVAMQEKVKKMFGADKVREAIIIDITSGKYSIFDSDGLGAKEKQRPTSAENEVPYKTYSFSQQVFAEGFVPGSTFQITDSDKAAEFISGHRLGERDKLSLIVLNRQKRVTGNIFLPWTSLDGVDVNKAAGIIAKFIHQMGGESGILYGSGTISRGTLTPLARAISNYEVRLDDFISVEGKSAYQYGAMEEGVEYQPTAGNTGLANEDSVPYDDSGISDEELAVYDAGRYSFAESITQGLVDLATKNADDQQLRMNAMREFGGNLAKLQKLMNKQKAYDKATVDDIVRLTRMVMGNGFFKDMRASEVKRLLAAIKKGVGVEDLTPIANNVVDMLVQHQLRESKNMLHKLMQVRGRKVDARGVEVQAGLDIDGQRMMSALKDGMSLGENGLLTRINDCENRLGSEDEVIRKNAMSEYQGLMLAKEYHDNILSGEEEEIVLRQEKRQEQEKIYDFRREPVLDDDGNAIMNLDGSVRTVERKTLKPEFKGAMTDENKRLRHNTEAAIERIEQSIRESRMERVTSYIDFMSDVAGDVRASRERAAEWRAEQQQRVDEIHHNANSDLEGVPVQSQVKLPEGGLLAFNSNNDIVRLLFQPLATFEKMLRFFGRKAHNGEGYLFNRFMRGWVDCSDKEWRSKRAAHEELDAKVNELFGNKAKRWSDLYKVERNKKHPGIPVEYWDNGERVQETMSQGEALSLVVWSKQKDAEAGLRRMGISEEDIETIKNNLDPKFLQLAEWVVEEFLPKRREYYNEVHERMFGAPMAAIEHYFPIVRNSRDVEKPSDITERDLGETKPSTITGNIIKRQRTAATLDVPTDFFDHLLKHLDDMENWAAWAEFNRDINTLRNYKRFKNRVLNMHSVEYGSGKDLWKAFDDACAIAAGVYHPSTKRGSGDNLAVNIAKGVTGAKIAFRFYTAAKQLLSLPAFWNGDASLFELAKWENPVGAIIAWNWAMKNLPGFSKRWQSRQVGDVRLMDTDSDYAFWRNNMVRALGRGGMWANALVDGMTVAMGARSVYETKKKRYLRNGYSEEQAEKRAMQDAAISYNSSQQSSEDAFLSSLQLDRTWWSTLMTVFRSASMGYQRRLTTGLRNLKNRTKKGYKAESIAFMKKQMERDGVDEATAEKAAKRTYRWGGLRSMADVFVYGFVLPFFWNLGPYALYLLMGDDDDEKKDMLKDAAVHSLFGPVEGLTGGQAMSEIGNTYAGYLMSDNDKSLLNALRYHDYLSMPLGSDLQQIFNEAGTDSMAAWTDAFNLLVQAGIGVNPETFTDAWVAIADACDGDPQTTKEFALCFMRVMQVPQTQVDKLFVDELGMTARDAQKLNTMEMADRYAKYKKFRNAPLLNWAYSADESQKVAEKYRNRFLDNMQERMERLNDEQLEWNFENPNDSERRKAIGKAYAKGKGVKDTAGQKPASNWNSETRRSQLKYQRLRDWTDLAEDVLLDTAIEQAKNRGDDEKLKALRDAKKELTEIKRGKHTETWDIDGLGDGSAEDDKGIMEELRARRKELLRELGVI